MAAAKGMKPNAFVFTTPLWCQRAARTLQSHRSLAPSCALEGRVGGLSPIPATPWDRQRLPPSPGGIVPFSCSGPPPAGDTTLGCPVLAHLCAARGLWGVPLSRELGSVSLR